MASSFAAGSLADIELTTTLLMAQLGLEDAEVLRVLAADTPALDDEFSNEDYALRIQAQYFQDMLQIMEDHKLALTFDEGLEANYPAFRNVNPGANPPIPDLHIDPVEDESDDEYLGPEIQHLMDRPNSPLLLSPVMSGPGSDAPLSPALSYVGSEVDEDEVLDIYFPHGRDPSIPTQIRCIICEDEFTEDSALLAPCDHYYCKECVVNFVTACTRDESVFPPKCCDQRIPSSSIILFLPTETQTLFVHKVLEYTVPISERVYCPTADCSAFLGSSEHHGNEITCNNCDARVCVLCKQVAHPGDTCSESIVTQEVRALARSEGWQTCPECSAIIELYQGCFHMTCRCRAQFCYLCAVPWKQCSCPQFEENRL